MISSPLINNLLFPIAKISNSCSPEISGVYLHENLTRTSGLSLPPIISFAKPSNIQNLLPFRILLEIRLSLPFAISKYSTKKPFSLVKELFISGK